VCACVCVCVCVRVCVCLRGGIAKFLPVAMPMVQLTAHRQHCTDHTPSSLSQPHLNFPTRPNRSLSKRCSDARNNWGLHNLGGGLGGKGYTPGGAGLVACWLLGFMFLLGLLLKCSRQAFTTEAGDAGGGEGPFRHNLVGVLQTN